MRVRVEGVRRGRERVGGQVPLVGLVAELVPEVLRRLARPRAGVDVDKTIAGFST
jgi:hypothetical protein